MDNDLKIILSEIESVFKQSDNELLDVFISEITKANKIVCVGAGRVGLAMRGFSMRLTHLGYQAHYWGETNVPKLDSRDLLIIGSGSGETRTILKIAEIAKKEEIPILLVTSKTHSSIMSLANVGLTIGNGSGVAETVNSIQPMTTLFEQCISLYLDSIVIKLMKSTLQNSKDLENRHNVLE